MNRHVLVLLWCVPVWVTAWVLSIIGHLNLIARTTTPGVGFAETLVILGAAVVLAHLLVPLAYAAGLGLVQLRQPAARALAWTRQAMLWLLWVAFAGTLAAMIAFGWLAGPYGWFIGAIYVSIFAAFPVIGGLALLGLADAIRVIRKRGIMAPMNLCKAARL